LGALADSLYYWYLICFNPNETGSVGASGAGFGLTGILVAIAIDGSTTGRAKIATEVHTRITSQLFRKANMVLSGIFILIGVAVSLPFIDSHVNYTVHVFCGVIGFLVGEGYLYCESVARAKQGVSARENS
jgi:membrane associated rhomboid family serine protease